MRRVTTLSDSLLADLQIDYLDIPGVGGRIGMCACPGGRRVQAVNYDPAIDLTRDLDVVWAAGARWLVSLVEEHELDRLGLHALPLELRRLGIEWKHLPIADMGVPTAVFESRWETAGRDLRESLERGELVVLHCWAGLGRTGTVAARLLIEFGMEPAAAIVRVRDARRGAIQTRKQERYVLRVPQPG